MYNKKEKEFETTRHITVIESFAREVKIRVSQDSTNQKKKCQSTRIEKFTRELFHRIEKVGEKYYIILPAREHNT